MFVKSEHQPLAVYRDETSFCTEVVHHIPSTEVLGRRWCTKHRYNLHSAFSDQCACHNQPIGNSMSSVQRITPIDGASIPKRANWRNRSSQREIQNAEGNHQQRERSQVNQRRDRVELCGVAGSTPNVRVLPRGARSVAASLTRRSTTRC